MKLLYSMAIITITGASLCAMPEGVEVKPDGSLLLNGLKSNLVHYTYKYRRTDQNKSSIQASEGFPERKKGSFLLKGKWFLKGGESFIIEEKIIQTVEDTVDYSLVMDNPEKIASAITSLFVILPANEFISKALVIDGKPYDITKGIKNLKAKSVELPSKSGPITFTGNLVVTTADHRKYKTNVFSLRIALKNGTGRRDKASLNMKIKVKSQATQQVALPDSKTKGCKPQEYGLKPGKEFVINGIPFKITNRMLRVGSKPLDIVLSKPSKDNYLYLLHNAAGNFSNASITVKYEDGGVQQIALKKGEDIGHEGNAKRLSNAAVAKLAISGIDTWKGVYVSKFKLSGKAIKSIIFSMPKGEWNILAASLTDKERKRFKSKHIAAAGKDWIEIPALQPVKSGTPLDFSKLTGLDAPAGKYGNVIVSPQGYFVFSGKPGKRLKVLGTNLCFSANFLDKKKLKTWLMKLRLLVITQ